MDLHCEECGTLVCTVGFVDTSPPYVFCSRTCYQVSARKLYRETGKFLKPRIYRGVVPSKNILEMDVSIGELIG